LITQKKLRARNNQESAIRANAEGGSPVFLKYPLIVIAPVQGLLFLQRTHATGFAFCGSNLAGMI
jgi:hypothetical protein